MEKKYKKIVTIVFIFMVIALLTTAIILAITNTKESGPVKDKDREGDPSYYYVDEYEESKKTQIDEDEKLYQIDEISQMVAKADFSKASNYLKDYFKTHSKEGEGEELYNYYKDVTTLLNIPTTSPTDYETVYSSFSGDTTFLAAVIYYPASYKISAFMNENSIVPTTHDTNVEFFEAREVDLETYNQMKASCSDFGGGEVIDFTIDGMLYTATLFYNSDHFYKVWDLTTQDQNNYFQTVAEWQQFLQNEN